MHPKTQEETARQDTDNKRYMLGARITDRYELCLSLTDTDDHDASVHMAIPLTPADIPNVIKHFLEQTQGAIPAFTEESDRIVRGYLLAADDRRYSWRHLADFLPDYIPATPDQGDYEAFRAQALTTLAGLEEEMRADQEYGEGSCFTLYTIHSEYAGHDARDYLASLQSDGATLAPHWEAILTAEDDDTLDLDAYEAALDMLETRARAYGDRINELADRDPDRIPGVTYGSLWMDGPLCYVVYVDADYLASIDGTQEEGE